LRRTSVGFPLLSGDFTGQLVVGDSPVGPDSWSGQLLGLAIYDQKLTAAQVLQHYEAWTNNRWRDLAENEDNVARYFFDEHAGRVVYNHVGSGVDLYIPQRYMIVNQRFLQPFWEEFRTDWSYWKNVLINIGGFIPFGFFFCAYLSSVRNIQRPALATIILGGGLSLTIEVLQAYLPTRQSGMTDVITNTLGTCVGITLFHFERTRAIYRTSPNLIPFARFDDLHSRGRVAHSRDR
jgi:hypothetical protein